MRMFKKICKNCGMFYLATGSKQIYCDICGSIDVKCSICGKVFPISRNKFFYSLENNNGKFKFICSAKCNSINAASYSCSLLKEKFCEKCNKITKWNNNGTCRSCISKQNLQSENMQKWIKSEECNKIRRKNGIKWNNSKEGKEFHSKVLKNFNLTQKGKENTLRNLNIIHNNMRNELGANSKENIKKRLVNTNFGNGITKNFCEKCNEITNHINSRCLQCDPLPSSSNFITRNNVCYYKGIEVESFARKILNHELDINNYPDISIRCGRVCCETEDIITSSEKLIKTNSNFEVKNHVLYFYDRSVNDYIPWEEYKKKFILYHNCDLNSILSNFKLYSTFRSQRSNNWENGSKSAFEQSLVDDGITWFIYIKFYLDKQNNSKPLVCGKSGSILVNNSGSDLSFSTDINDGPARRFLAENSGKYLWDKTKIAILSCNSEKEAYELENKYTELLNLFRS